MKTALAVVGSFLVLLTALPIVRTEKWWIRSLDFPRLQIAALLTVVLAASASFYNLASIVDNLLLTAFTASFGYQAYRIFPYTRLSAPQTAEARSPQASRSIRLLIANVLMENRQADHFIEMIAECRPDMVLTVETDAWWERKLTAMEPTYPFALNCALENTYGMHLFSKLEFRSPEIRFLVEEDVPSIRTEVCLKSGDWIVFYGIHPRPPQPQQDTEKRDAEILLIGEQVAAEARPAIIAGDLNDVAWSHTTRLFQRISGALDPRVGRGMFSTFNARYALLRWPLDHVFHTSEFALRELRRLSYFGSDHFPVLVELSFEPDAALRQSAPAASEEDRAEAVDKIQEA